ncbi:hypothetical protein ESCO_000243 [Escovopsis weberi]|uniref:Autophagy-related protein 14 n=1 Tax=Escovopsis weberi TaxID=150374 RepID=A0A0N0RTA8_ESCWE|nr:hypothetical protein ESCO_000243 [Escovopsis weberi]
MECGICCRHHDALRNPFLCPVDARLKIYDSRLKQLSILLENEAFQGRIHSLADDTARPTAYTRQETLAEQFLAEQRTDQILQAADRLRVEIKAARDEVRARKASLARRKSDLASVAAGLAERRAKQQKEMEKSIGMVKFRWAQSTEDMAATRAFLCTEAVRLYGLRRSTKKATTGRYEYFLGKVPVVDLTAMDTLSPEVISTSLAHIAHILILISHYLAIRLPAEITLPHRDYPRPTIFNLQNSYRHGEVSSEDPLTTPTITAKSSTNFHSHVPRPRPLFVDKPLSELSKEDPAAYSLFLEGVTLLAYNIAWMCCSQGLPVGEKASFEDICNLGRNLYGLLSSQAQGVGSLAIPTPGADTFTYENQNQDQDQDQDQDADEDHNWLGRYSHGTGYYFLGGSGGTELIKSFRILNPVKLADKLKKRLIGDAPAPDWEVLDDAAWKEEDVVGNAGVEAMGNSDKAEASASSTRRNSNGWMKVKSRFS